MTKPSVVARESQHTALPWFATDRGIGWEISRDANGNAQINDEFRDTFTKADAEFIVRACNAHTKLVKALRESISALQVELGSATGEQVCANEKIFVMKAKVIEQVEQALRLAQGEK